MPQRPDEMFQLIEENRSGLGRYLSWVDAVFDIPSTEAFINERVLSGCLVLNPLTVMMVTPR